MTAVRTILIIEDEEPLRELARVAIGSEFAYAEAADGLEGLALARSSPPDLIVLDLMLPGMSGTDVLATLRADPATRATPVLVVTAWTEARDRVLAAGADGFVRKPFDPDDLRATVRELLDGVRERDG